MSYEDDRPILLFDGDRAEETPFEAEQRRGRERMIALWRAAVQCVTEAAQREAEQRAKADEPQAAEADAAPDEVAEPDSGVETWVFPPKAAAAS